MKPSAVSCSNRASPHPTPELRLKPAPVLAPELIDEEQDGHGAGAFRAEREPRPERAGARARAQCEAVEPQRGQRPGPVGVPAHRRGPRRAAERGVREQNAAQRELQRPSEPGDRDRDDGERVHRDVPHRQDAGRRGRDAPRAAGISRIRLRRRRG